MSGRSRYDKWTDMRRQGWTIGRRRLPFWTWRFWTGRGWAQHTCDVVFFERWENAEEELLNLTLSKAYEAQILPAEEIIWCRNGQPEKRSVQVQTSP